MNENFHSQFAGAYNSGDLYEANNVLLRELGCLLVNKRDDFVFLLNESGIPARSSMSDDQLIDLFLLNVGENKKLALGAALFVNMNNKRSGIDGEEVLSDDMVKAGYKTLSGFSNAGGAIAGAISSVAQLGSNISQNQRAKKYGAMDALTAQAKAKNQMQVQAAKARQEQEKTKLQKAKNKKVIVIAVVSILAVAIIVTGIIIYKKKRN